MSSKTESILAKLLKNAVLLQIALIPLIMFPFTNEIFEFPKVIFLYISSVFNLLILLLVFNIKTKLDVPVIIFFLLYLLSTIFSTHKYTSIWGYYTRFNGGLISISCYIIFYYSLSYLIKQGILTYKKILPTIRLSLVFVSIYAILQHFGIDKNLWKATFNPTLRAFSTIGQPNWLASYTIMVLPLFLPDYPLTYLLGYASFWYAYSLSGILGFLSSISYTLTQKPKNMRKALIILALCFTFSLLQLSLFKERVINSIKNLRGYVIQTANAQVKSNIPKTGDTANIRLIIWKGTLNLIFSSPKTFLIGTGPETFAYNFGKFRPKELNETSERNLLFNKPHNYYLELWSETGILGLLAYLYLVISFLKITTNNKLKAGMIGFLVSNLFGWPTATTTLFFFLFLALSKVDHRPKRISINKAKKVLYLPVFLFSAYLVINAINIFLADIHYKQGGIKHLQEAIKLNPREPAYHRKLSIVYLKNKDYKGAKEEITKALNLNQKNILTLKTALFVYGNLAQTNQKYLEDFSKITKLLLTLDPTDPSL